MLRDLRSDFPVFDLPVYGKKFVYLDTGATAQKPRAVINAVKEFLETSYANVHRGVYNLSQRSTAAYENARAKIIRFINAESDANIVFTKNATEAINLVAHSFGDAFLHAGDEIIISELEHHANIVPWQMLRDRKNITLKIAPIRHDGAFDMEAFLKLLNNKTKLVSVSYMSNALGVIQPVREIIEVAHAVGARVMLDACQAVTHMPVDVQELDCDFLAFSGHKLYGPSGIGVLYGKSELLEQMPPFLGGGDMIDTVTFEKTTYAAPPRRFEAGTPPIAEAIGLGAAIDYLTQFGMEAIASHEYELLGYAMEQLRGMNDIMVYGTAQPKGGIISFTMKNAHPQDIATILDQSGVAVRAGHHCCMPLMKRLGVSATARASFGIYNTKEDVDALVAGLQTVRELCG